MSKFSQSHRRVTQGTSSAAVDLPATVITAFCNFGTVAASWVQTVPQPDTWELDRSFDAVIWDHLATIAGGTLLHIDAGLFCGIDASVGYRVQGKFSGVLGPLSNESATEYDEP